MRGVILIAVDFDDASRRAIDLGKELAAKLAGEPVLVHVYQLPVYTYPSLEPTILPGFYREVTDAARGALEHLATEVGVARSELREGDPASEILAAARELGATLIVMGTHGRHGLSHALLGSVAERVIRHGDTPVITVRAAEPARVEPG